MNIIEFYNSEQYKKNTLTIICYFNDSCNYNCLYCCNVFPRRKQFINICNLINYIDSYFKEFKRSIKLIVLGGEPTLHLDFYRFCIEISKRQFVQCTIVSNFSANIQLYKSILDLNIKLILSWHSNNIVFIHKLKQLTQLNNSYKSQIYIAVMFENNKFQQIKTLIDNILNLSINFNLICIIKPHKNITTYNYEYTQEQFSYYKQINTLNTNFYKDFIIKTNVEIYTIKLNEFFTIDETINNFKMYKCYAGKDEIYIHSDGKIYPCEDTYRLLQKSIGTIDIFDKNIFKYHYCRINICGSPYFSKKVKILNHL